VSKLRRAGREVFQRHSPAAGFAFRRFQVASRACKSPRGTMQNPHGFASRYGSRRPTPTQVYSSSFWVTKGSVTPSPGVST
jgi:hypothetical protein